MSGGAELRRWLLQRLSAAGLLAGASLLLVAWWQSEAGYAGWRALVGHPVWGAVWLVVIATLCLHAWIGIRRLLLDGVRRLRWRLLLLGLAGAWLLGCAAWAVSIVLGAGR